jgi:hypothetical protein
MIPFVFPPFGALLVGRVRSVCEMRPKEVDRRQHSVLCEKSGLEMAARPPRARSRGVHRFIPWQLDRR